MVIAVRARLRTLAPDSLAQSDWCWWYFCLRVLFVSQELLVNSRLTSLERGLVVGFLGLGACALVLLQLLAVRVS